MLYVLFFPSVLRLITKYLKGLNASCTLLNQVCLTRCMCSQKEEKQRWGVEVLVWLYEQLQRGGQAGSPRDSHHHHHWTKDEKDGNREEEQEAQSSFLSGHLAVLFGLLMMGQAGLENREAILGDGIGLSRSPPSPLTSKQGRMGRRGRREKRQVVDEKDGTVAMSRPRLRLDRLTNQAREFGAFYNVVSRRMMMGHGHGHTGGRALGNEVGGEGRSGGGGSGVVESVVEFLEGLKGLS